MGSQRKGSTRALCEIAGGFCETCVFHMTQHGHSGKQLVISQSYMRVSHDPAIIFLGIWERNESVSKGLYVDIHRSLVHNGQNQKQSSSPIGKRMISNFLIGIIEHHLVIKREWTIDVCDAVDAFQKHSAVPKRQTWKIIYSLLPSKRNSAKDESNL